MMLNQTQKKLALILAICLLPVVGIAIASVFPTATNQGYAPGQPIPFSHKLHAGQYKVACNYCHSAVEKSRHATIPAVNVCMNCHSVVKPDSPHIQKLKKHFEEGKPVEWVRVHELPDFVYFPHKRHIAKGVACETCHGNVKGMDKIEQAQSLTMGWCIDCHRGTTTPKNVLRNVYPDQKDPHGAVATTSCSACHH